jgi:purine nucleosidase
MTTRVILDTDIGTDVDDCLALALILGSPELELAGVTCVYGDVALRARIVRQLLALHGTHDVPVLQGASDTLLGLRPIYWEGHEGQGLIEAAQDTPAPNEEAAVDFIVRTAREESGAIHLLAIGPLTNVALALKRAPRLVHDLAGVTIMGGVVRGPGRLDLPYVEHNIRSDPEAAQIVFAAGLPITLVPLDVTTRVRINREGVERIAAAGTPFHAAVADQVTRYPRFGRLGYTYLHDPLAAAIVARPDLVTSTEAHLDLELGGHHTAGATLLRAPNDDAPANVRVALDVDVAAAEEFVIARIANRAAG